MRKCYIFLGILAVIAVLAGVTTGIVVASTSSDIAAQNQQISSLQNKQSVQTAAKGANTREVTIDKNRSIEDTSAIRSALISAVSWSSSNYDKSRTQFLTNYKIADNSTVATQFLPKDGPLGNGMTLDKLQGSYYNPLPTTIVVYPVDFKDYVYTYYVYCQYTAYGFDNWDTMFKFQVNVEGKIVGIDYIGLD